MNMQVKNPIVAEVVGVKRGFSKKRLLMLSVLVVLAGSAAAYGYRWWTVGRFIETTDDAYIGANVTTITAHVGGYVQRILVADNQYVKAGQLLVRLEDQDYQASLDAVQAQVRQRRAAMTNLAARRNLAEAMIAKADADLKAAQAEADFARQDAQRYRNLAAIQAASKQNAQRARTAFRTAESNVAAARAALDAEKLKVSVIDTQIASARAALQEAQAQEETARLRLGYTEIRAPVDGYVGDRSAHVGTYVSSGTQLLSIVPSTGLWVDANFKEDQLAAMKPGQPVQIVADVLPGWHFVGTVESMAPATGSIFSVIPAQNATGNFTKIVQRVPVRIALDGAAATLGQLRPGLSLTISVNTEKTPASRVASR